MSREESDPYNTRVSGQEASVGVLESSDSEAAAAVVGLSDAVAGAAVAVSSVDAASSVAPALAEMVGSAGPGEPRPSSPHRYDRTGDDDRCGGDVDVDGGKQRLPSL